MLVRTLRNAAETLLFERGASRVIVAAEDKVDHAVFDTSFDIGPVAKIRISALAGFQAQAHYCIEGRGIGFVDDIGHLITGGTVLAAGIGRKIAFEPESPMRIVTVLGTASAEDHVVVRSLDDVIGSERDVFWGNGYSRRLLVRRDGFGFALCVTQGNPDTDSPLQYRNHFESCYYVSGSGEYVWDGGRHPIDTNGGISTVFVMNENDAHRMVVKEEATCLSIFSPAIEGHESHSLGEGQASSY